MRIELASNAALDRDKLLRDLVAMHYERNDVDFHRGVFRVRGDRVEIFPAYEEERAVRIEFFGDEIEASPKSTPCAAACKNGSRPSPFFRPATMSPGKRTLKMAIETIQAELKQRIDFFRAQNQLIEAQRIEERTDFDLEMMQELGYCNGIENYSRHLTGRAPGEPPPTLLDYFPPDFLMFIDESHIAVPQLNGMYRGDRSRKETLVSFGFRLPSALDNRPLRFDEFSARVAQVVYVSATPADYEMEKSRDASSSRSCGPPG
jgi:excinuclease ABC subunit B